MNALLLALQFLTVIPLSFSFNASEKQLGQSTLFYPLIGLLIGSLLVFSSLFIHDFSLSTQAALILIAWVFLTGGLHLDGLADCADAWVGGFGSQKRSLEIMKDPAAGSMAVLALTLLLLLKWSLISSLLEKQLVNALFLIPCLGRASLLILMSTSNYIRTGGLGEKIVENLPQRAVIRLVFVNIFIAVFFLGVLAVMVMLLAVFIIRFYANKRLAGMTGDVYGATVELVEVGLLMSVVL